MRTRVFQSGNSQAVRIPKELQYEQLDAEYEIERQGDTLSVWPCHRIIISSMTLRHPH
jgi:antitoxin VapB